MTRDRTGQGHIVVVFGSTGTAGTGVVHACLAEPIVSEVRAITRRPLAASHAKLHEVDRGRAMLRVGLDESWHGSRTLENKDLKALLVEGQHR